MLKDIKAKITRSYIFQMMLMLLLAAQTAIDTNNPQTFKNTLTFIQKDAKAKNANVTMLTISILGIIVGGVMIYIGLFMTATVNNTMPAVINDTGYNDTKQKTASYINTSFTLLGVVLMFSCFGLMIYSIWSMIPR